MIYIEYYLFFPFLFIFLSSICYKIIQFYQSLAFKHGEAKYEHGKLNLMYEKSTFYSLSGLTKEERGRLLLFVVDIRRKVHMFLINPEIIKNYEKLIKNTIFPTYGKNVTCYLGNANALCHLTFRKKFLSNGS